MKNYMKYFRKEIGNLVVLLLLSFTTIAISFIEPQITSRLMILLTDQKLKRAFYFTLIIFVINISTSIIAFFTQLLITKLKNKIAYAISWDLTGILASSTYQSVQDLDSEAIVSRITESNYFVNCIFNMFGNLGTLLTGIIILFYTAHTSLPVFVLFLGIIGFVLLSQKWIHQKLVSRDVLSKNSTEKLKNFLIEIGNAFLDIKVQNMIPTLKPKFSDALETDTANRIKIENLHNKNSILIRVTQSSYLLLFLGLGILLISKNQLSVEQMITLFMYRNYMNALVGAILKITSDYSSAKTCCIRMNKISDLKRFDYEQHGKKKLKQIQGSLEVKNLSVTIEERKILDHINITFPANSFIGIVGNSGCGKSTLLKVLAHEIKPDTGEVLMDGININELDLISLRKSVRLAPQSPHLFSMSIRDNLKLVNPDATDEEIWQALKLSDAEQLVKENGGLDTEIDDEKMSGGEKQKIALARIALQKSKIILLDEATSALDNISQSNIISVLQQATDYHTIIMVAHKLSTVKNADMLVFMEQGKIIATGTFDELYKTCPEFRKLADLA